MHWLGDSSLRAVVAFLVRLVEAGAAAVIFVGAALGFWRFLRAFHRGRRGERFSFNAVRLDLGRYLALGLELQLASDLLRTAVAPSFEEIGKMAAIAAIRTALNFFLGREIEQERKMEELRATPSATRPDAVPAERSTT